MIKPKRSISSEFFRLRTKDYDLRIVLQNKANRNTATMKIQNEPNLNRRLMSDMQLLKKFSEVK